MTELYCSQRAPFEAEVVVLHVIIIIASTLHVQLVSIT